MRVVPGKHQIVAIDPLEEAPVVEVELLVLDITVCQFLKVVRQGKSLILAQPELKWHDVQILLTLILMGGVET